MRTSETLNKLIPALISAQAAFNPAIKDSTNPHFGNKYVDLSGVIDATKDALRDHGLAVVQACEGDESSIQAKAVTITTRILHASGEWMESELWIPAGNPQRFDAQTVGSAITYGRRYSYMGILGIAPEDDDGQLAAGNGKAAAQQSQGVQRKGAATGVQGQGRVMADALLSPPEADSGPLFDETGEEVHRHPASAPQRQQNVNPVPNTVAQVVRNQNGGRVVTVPMSKRWLAISLSYRIEKLGMTKNEAWTDINNYLGSLGVEKAEEMLSKDYQMACDWGEGK